MKEQELRLRPFSLLLAGLPIALLAWLLLDRAPVDEAPRTASLKAVAHPVIPRAAAAGTKAAPAPASTMRTQFETAPNYAAFIHDAMSRPSEGGRFYAFLAHSRCFEASGAKLDSRVPSTNHPERQEEALRFAADLQQRCSGVAAQFPDTATFWRSLMHSNAKGTPDRLLMFPLAASSDTSGEDLRRARELGDPYLLAATLELQVELIAEGIDPAYASGRNREVLFTAAGAAACEIIGDCHDNWRLKFYCAVGGHCEFDDYRDFARDGLKPESRPLFDRTLKALVKGAGH